MAQLGVDGAASFGTPRWVELPDGFIPVDVAAGDGFTCVRSARKRVHCFGLQERWSPFVPPRDGVDIAAACREGELSELDCDLHDNMRGVDLVRRRGQTELRKPIDDALAISAGQGGMCVLGDGGVRCYEMDPLGAVPFMDDEESSAISGTADAVEVVGGALWGCVRKANDDVACWSHNALAKSVPGLGPVTALSIGTGRIACAVRDNGGVRCFDGRDKVWDIAGLEDVVSVDVGDNTFCARKRDGSVWCWGRRTDRWHPNTGLAPVSVPTKVGGVQSTQVAAGGGFACATETDGVRCWGARGFGRTGDGLAPEVVSPIAVALSGPAIDIAADSSQTCAVLTDGTAQCWGLRNAEPGALPIEANALHTVPGIEDATRIWTGDGTSCALTGGGAVRCWVGRDQPRLVPDLADPTWVDPDGYHCAVQRDGSVHCFIFDNEGPLPMPGQRAVTQLESGSADGVVSLTRDGDVAFLSIYPKVTRVDPLPTPTRSALPALGQAVDIATDGMVACAARRDGEVWCRNLTGYGSTHTKKPIPPTKVPYVTDAVEVAMASRSALDHILCFRRQDGRVGCIGDHTRGSLGDGLARPPGILPGYATVAGVDDAAGIAVGGSHACVRHTDGDISCWGDDTYGQVSGIAHGYASCAVRVHAAD